MPTAVLKLFAGQGTMTDGRTKRANSNYNSNNNNNNNNNNNINTSIIFN